MSEGIRLTRDLTALGYTINDVTRMVRTGELVPVRRGAYAVGSETELDSWARHRRLVEATLPRCSPEAVVSDMSATALHLLPIWTEELTRVHLTRDRPGTTTITPAVHLRGLALPPEDVVMIDGIAVTSLARTVLDLACRLPLDRAVAIGDAALKLGLARQELAACQDRAGRRVGIAGVRRTLPLLDERSESVGESQSRVILHLNGIPAPIPQFTVFDETGDFVARCDFGWPEFGTVGEFDGKVKYSRALRPGHVPEDELFREKQREDAIRRLGFQVVRWITRDLYPPTTLLDRLRQAFARGRR